MRATELMTADPEVLTGQDTVRAAAEQMRNLDVGLIPVVDDRSDRRLIGVITDRDIAVRHVAEGHDPEGCVVSDEMTSAPLFTVGPEDDESVVMERMRVGKVRRVPVVDDGRIVGIIAQADLAVETPASEADEVEETVEEISEPAEPNR